MNNTISSQAKYDITDFELIKEKVLNWIRRFNTFCFLDNHQYQISPHSMECLAGAGIKKSIRSNSENTLDELTQFLEDFGTSKDRWLFGHFAYDLRNDPKRSVSVHPDHIQFADLFFFEPEVIIRLNEKELIIHADHPEKIYKAIQSMESARMETRVSSNSAGIRNRISKEEYISIIEQLKQHILYGDCYEINFCQEFFMEQVHLDPLMIYNKLGEHSPNPFSALYRVDDQWLICASPERFLRKQGDRIMSQPIKGTSRRIEGNEAKDELSKEHLRQSVKDRSENVMVVDLVRNDLAKICKQATVTVDELYGVYSFPQVHQMISTVSGTLQDNISFADIIRATFPMGSMTGAPKKRVMELIEQYEKTRRGIFSGAVGYISPNDDFDFNVVIRSIMYNAASEYLSFQAGSGITFYSDPENEWEECMLKAEAIRKVLGFEL